MGAANSSKIRVFPGAGGLASHILNAKHGRKLGVAMSVHGLEFKQLSKDLMAPEWKRQKSDWEKWAKSAIQGGGRKSLNWPNPPST